MEQCVALVDYEAIEGDEISFRRGDVISVTAKGGTSGFWEGFVTVQGHGKGTAKESRGIFPSCFVSSNLRPEQRPVFCNMALALYDYKAEDRSEISFRRGDCFRVVRPSASSGWWLGFNESEADRMRQRKAPESEITRACGTATEPRLLPSNFLTCNIVLAVFSFEAKQKHELKCSVGDVIQVYRKWNDGWWEGGLRGRRGIFPSNFTFPNVATTIPPFFCNVCKTIFADDSTRCEKCAKDDDITQLMIAALDDYAAGKMNKLDLFAYVDVDTTGGIKEVVVSADEGSVQNDPDGMS